MLGIIIGIGSVIAILTVGDSLTISVSENMQSMGANDIYVMVEPKKQNEEEGNIDGIKFGAFSQNYEFNSEDYISKEMIRNVCDNFSDEIYAINIENNIGNAVVENGKKSSSMNISGVSAGFFVSNNIDMIGGSLFSLKDFEEGKNVIIVTDSFVDDIYEGDIKKALGSEIEVNCNGYIGIFTIVGVYKYQQNYAMGISIGGGSTNSYIPLKTALNFYHEDSNYQYFQVVTNVGVNSDDLAARIKNFLSPYYRNNRNYEINAITLTSMVSMLSNMMSTITVAIAVIAGIALLVGGIGVMNIMLVSITERTREIGTRKAIGATNSSIRVQFIVEAMIICLIGGAIGVVFGILAGVGLSNMLGYPAKPSIPGVLISLIFSMTIGVFFGYYPANKAAKMNPIDALRYE